ncbi:MAG TPA: 4-alpha-glucanotransferase [Clostridia bacterium]|nr:MAG: 4-alpha-glucanotransferase [Firmicutes bacterium ADurb.Bin146]HQM39929.1 4-alpha-glucanotransferase [Clostridia bacterium]
MRASGILLPIFSLPSPYGIGTIGKAAYEFVDFLVSAKQRYWQILPLGPTGYGDSPYQSFCSFACNSYLIDLDILEDKGLLYKEEYQDEIWFEKEDKVDYGLMYQKRNAILEKAFNRFDVNNIKFKAYCQENVYWINDYAIFMALKEHFNGDKWQLWPDDIRLIYDKALVEYGALLSRRIMFHKFLQYEFFTQWSELKKYANGKGILIIGDIPIYVSSDSSDVWSRHYLFQTDENRNLTSVAGVPPDAFSATGQLWGNPLYDWEAMEKDNFYWWKQRIGMASSLYNYVRIDHFIGVERYFSIPSDASTAALGTYFQGPGMKLIDAINQSRNSMGIIAEDLGVLTDNVRRLLEKTGYPGMKVLQFGFSGEPSNDNLPMHYKKNLVAYTATHDNDTTKGWFGKLDIKNKEFAKKYLNRSRINVHDLILETMKSVADTAIIPIQDWLSQDSQSRINFPSIAFGNWTYRITKNMLTDSLTCKISDMTNLCAR